MARTTYYLNELQPYAKNHLDMLKRIGENAEGYSRKQIVRASIRGYLTALNDAGIISDVAFRCLYIYYTSFMNKEVKEND